MTRRFALKGTLPKHLQSDKIIGKRRNKLIWNSKEELKKIKKKFGNRIPEFRLAKKILLEDPRGPN